MEKTLYSQRTKLIIMRVPTIISLSLAVLLLGCNAQKNTSEGTSNTTLQTQIDSVSYSIGASIGNNLKGQGFDTLNTDLLAYGVRQVMNGEEPKISQQEGNQLISSYVQGTQKKEGTENRKKAEAFLKENATKEGVKETESGLQYKVLREGDGASPTIDDKVKVHYHGTKLNGEVFDSSVDRGEPATFPVKGVIQGWQEAIPMMKVGGKRKLWIPSDLAYGEQGRPGIGSNQMLIFEVELLDIVKGKGNSGQQQK